MTVLSAVSWWREWPETRWLAVGWECVGVLALTSKAYVIPGKPPCLSSKGLGQGFSSLRGRCQVTRSLRVT